MIKCGQGENSSCGKVCCCLSCDEREKCKDICTMVQNGNVKDASDCVDSFTEENAIATMKSAAVETIKAISDIVTAKKALEEQEKAMKGQLQKVMEQFGVKAFDNEIIKVTYIGESVRNSIDTPKLKKKYPEIAAECNKTSSVKAFVKIEVK